MGTARHRDGLESAKDGGCGVVRVPFEGGDEFKHLLRVGFRTGRPPRSQRPGGPGGCRRTQPASYRDLIPNSRDAADDPHPTASCAAASTASSDVDPGA